MLPWTAADIFRNPTDPHQMHEIHEVYNDEDSDTDDSSSDNDDSSVDSGTSTRKGRKEQPPTTVINILIHNKRTDREETMVVLLDSGSTTCLGTTKAAERAGLKVKTNKSTLRHKTAAGTFATNKETKIRKHRVLELNSRRILKNLTVKLSDGDLGRYDFILGRDYLTKYGFDLCFSDGTIRWDGMRVKMKQPN